MNKLSIMKKMVMAFFCSIIMQGAHATPPTGSVPDGVISEKLLNPKTWLSFAQSVGGALKWPMRKGVEEGPGFVTNAFTLCQESPLLASTFAAIYLWNHGDNVVDTCNFMVDNRWSIVTTLGSVVVQDFCAKYPDIAPVSCCLAVLTMPIYFVANPQKLVDLRNSIFNATTTNEKLCRTAVLSAVLGSLWNAC